MFDHNRSKALFAALLSTLFVCGDGSVVVASVDIEVRVGDSTFLNCSASEVSGDVHWFHYSVEHPQTQKYVYYNGHVFEPYDVRFKVERHAPTGSFNLIMTKVDLQDAGSYICQDSLTDNSRMAQLIVLESDPICKSNINPSGFIGPNDCGLKQGTIWMSCSIDYKGNVAPKLQWVRVTQNNVISVEDSSNCSTSNRPTTGRLSCNHSANSDIQLDGSYFLCQTTKSTGKQYKCQMDVIKIHYAAGNWNLIEKTVGDTVECFANTSSLLCTYEWIWSDGKSKETSSKGNKLKITNHGGHRCIAKCIIKDTVCTFTVTTVLATQANDSPIINNTVGNWMALLLLVLLLALFGYIIYVRLSSRTASFLGKEKQERQEIDRKSVPEENEQLLRKTGVPQQDESSKRAYENLSYTAESQETKTKSTEKGADTEVTGIALLNKKLYVTHKDNRAIMVYDSPLLNYENSFNIDTLLNPLDIASSQLTNCLFVAGLTDLDSRIQIMRLNVDGGVISRWSIDGQDCRLSVYESNVVVCSISENQLIEFSPDGEPIWTAKLSPIIGFSKLWHAIKVSETKYAVSHTVPQRDEHRVSIVVRDMKVKEQDSVELEFITTSQMCGMNIPICLSQWSPERILVAENLNNRVTLIDIAKKSCEVLIRDGRIKNLLSQSKLDHHPVRICFDKDNGELYVAMSGSDMKGGIISTFMGQMKSYNAPSLYSKKIHECIAANGRKTSQVITGITVLSEHLYVVQEYSPVILVYDSNNLEPRENLNVEHYLTNPLDITSSHSSKHLFIADLPNIQSQCRTKRLTVSGKVLNHWFIDDNKCRLSVYQSNVIVCLSNKNEIIEFKSDGEKVVRIDLTADIDAVRLLHAIKITGSRFVASYALKESDGYRVCVIEVNDQTELENKSANTVRIVASTSPESCGLNVPKCLLIDINERILVAEYLNNRVLKIDPGTNTCEILIRDGRLKNLRSHCTIKHHPIRMCFDESRGRLFVAQGGSYLKQGIISSFKMLTTK